MITITDQIKESLVKALHDFESISLIDQNEINSITNDVIDYIEGGE